jgi:tetratricopeptide (TPR) repeat protein
MSAIDRRAIQVALLASSLMLTACEKAPPELPPFQGDSEFVLVHTEHNLGNIEPCSCNNRTTGGFPRRATALAELRQKHKHVLTLDSGNSLFSEDRKLQDPLMFEQAKLKARAIAHSYVAVDLDAMVFGEMDLLAGGDFFLELVAETGLPIVAANVYDRESGKPLFERYRIIDCGGMKVAIFGLVAEELHPTVSEPNAEGSVMVQTNQKVTVILEDRFERRNVKIEDPIKTAADLVPELRALAHVVVALTHIPPKMADDLTSRVPGIGYVIGRHVPTTRVSYTLDPVSGAMRLGAPMNGISLGVAEFKVRGGSLAFHDYSAVDKADLLVEAIDDKLADLRKQYGTDDPESLAAIDEELAERALKLRANRERHLQTKATSDPSKQSNFKHYPISLGNQFPDDPKLLKLVTDYRESLKSLYQEEMADRTKAIEPVAGMPHFVGAEACATCHRPQTEFWRGTKHGRAWQTMLDYKVEYDLDCITCHTVGFMLPGGFDRPDRVSGFEDVQCENCHGPGSMHVANVLADNSIIADAADMSCERCHNKEHSPAYKRITYVPRASCPPIDKWEPLMRGAYGRIRMEFEEILAKKGDATAPHTFSGLADIYLRLERWDDAIRVAERGMKIHDRITKGMTIAIAIALDGKGQTEDALQRLYGIYEEFKTDPKVIAQITELLIHGRQEAARNLGRASELIDYAIGQFEKEGGAFRKLRAEVLHARGQRKEAIDLLETLEEKSAGKNSHLTQLIARWRAELAAEAENAAPPPMRVPPLPK